MPLTGVCPFCNWLAWESLGFFEGFDHAFDPLFTGGFVGFVIGGDAVLFALDIVSQDIDGGELEAAFIEGIKGELAAFQCVVDHAGGAFVTGYLHLQGGIINGGDYDLAGVGVQGFCDGHAFLRP